MMDPKEFSKLLQESNRENNVILMEKLKKSIKEELTIFKYYIESMVSDALLEVNEKVLQLEEMVQEKDNEIMQLKSELNSHNAKTSDLRKEIHSISNKIEKLSEKSTSSEFHSRKRNVVLFKVAETERNNLELLKIVHDLIRTTADNNFRESDIDFVRRIGKKNSYPRPVLLGLTRVHKRNQLLNKSRSFLNKNLRVDEDLPKNILASRKPIYRLAKHLSRGGSKAWFRKDKLIVDGVEWSTEKVNHELRQLPRSANAI